jgi:L-amino acid N-acyltransferase YncA
VPVPDTGARIDPMTGDHAGAVLAIYRAGIEEGNATFETSVPGWAAFTAARLPAHRFVATTGGQVAGWVAASAVSGRCVYAGVVEHSVYVHPDARGRGIGRRLLEALIASTEAAGIWTIQSGIFPENTASLALHRAAGFRVVGTRERIGQHHGRWRDVILIERRSPAVLPVRQDCLHDTRVECQAGRVDAGELRRDQLRVTELGHGGLRRPVRGQAQAQVPSVGLLQPVGQLLHHRDGQLPGQRVEIGGDQAGSGHGTSSNTALTVAVNSRHAARRPASACWPASVSR